MVEQPIWVIVEHPIWPLSSESINLNLLLYDYSVYDY